MAWHGILGHDEVVEQFRLALRRGRLASSFVFAGPEGIGKRTFALKLAQALLCQARPEEAMDPCGTCPSCSQVPARTHPDLKLVAKPPDRAFLPLELLIGDDEHRMREGLCHDISLKPFMGGRKIAVVDDADFLRPEGANCLLKTLEEPPPRSVLILIGTSPAKQLPTIRSRCQLIRFRPLSEDDVAELLVSRELVTDAADARRLAAMSGGSLQRALEAADARLHALRIRVCEALAAPNFDSIQLGKSLAASIEEAGKATTARRAKLGQVVGFASDFYRHLLRQLAGAPPIEDDETGEPARRAAASWQGDHTTAAACLDRCLEAAGQLERNVNPTTLLECWLDDLAKITAGRPVAEYRF